MLRIRVLGSAAGGGFPQWNCNCPNCAGVRAGRAGLRERAQSSIAVGDGHGWALVNASPDVLAQIRAFDALQPARAIRDTAIVGVILMDSQIDHVTGLAMLREGPPLHVYATARTFEDLSDANPVLRILDHYCGVVRHEISLEPRSSFSVEGLPGVAFRGVPLESKAPPYSPHRADPQPGDNLGLAISVQDGRRAFYAPGLGAISAAVASEFAAADVLLVDGTCWRDDELIRLGISAKHARDMGHLPLEGSGGMLETLDRHTHKRRVLIHINNTNPILDETSREHAELRARGIEVAWDGMEIELH